MISTPSKILKIAVTGPESTGKSTLSAQLADYYQTVYVPEFARNYLTKLNRAYQEADLLTIAQGQILAEKELEKQAHQVLVIDTELLVLKIWSEHAYKHCHPWILEALQAQQYDLYLLTSIDIPWEYDPLREHPHLRTYFYNLYYQELMQRNFNFVKIKGKPEQRLKTAVEAINTLLQNKPKMEF